VIVDKYGRVGGSIDLAELAELYAQCDDDDLKGHYRQVAAENGLNLEAPDEPADLETVIEADTSGAVEDIENLGEIADAELAEAEAPPKSGAGSGRDVWAAYAESLGVEVTGDMTRDEIIEAVEEADDGDNDSA
jgi:hypothetical protein